MNTTIKRVLALLFAFTLVAAACGDSDDEGNGDTTTTTAADTGTDTEDDEEGGAEEDDEDATGETPSVPGDADCASDEVLCVGLVTDIGRVDDKSFNQSAWEGVQASGADVTNYIESTATGDYEANITAFLEQDYDIIVTVGFALQEATDAAAAANPETWFIGVDQFQAEVIDNVIGLTFEEDKAGFMAGALAGLLTESNVVGAVLGTDSVPPVVRFKEGWENGARHTNPDVQLLSSYHPSFDQAFTDPVWGANTARQTIDNGADIIFGAGGQTGNGALAEIAKDNGAVLCVGVDTDQWETVAEARPCLITSAMKLITPGVVDIIAAIAAGTAEGGNFVGDVNLAPFHDLADRVSPDVQAQLDEIIAGILDGSLPTGYTP